MKCFKKRRVLARIQKVHMLAFKQSLFGDRYVYFWETPIPEEKVDAYYKATEKAIRKIKSL